MFVHVAVDDHSRYAYIEQHPDERAETCAAFLGRALAHFGQLGVAPEAVMTDGAVACRRSRVVVALRRERMGVERELAGLRGLRPGMREWWAGDDLGRGEPPTVAERITACEQRIEAIDAEIARFSE